MTGLIFRVPTNRKKIPSRTERLFRTIDPISGFMNIYFKITTLQLATKTNLNCYNVKGKNQKLRASKRSTSRRDSSYALVLYSLPQKEICFAVCPNQRSTFE